MLGGRFDEHPWGITEATVVVRLLRGSVPQPGVQLQLRGVNALA